MPTNSLLPNPVQSCPALPSSGDFSLPQVSSEDDRRTNVDQPDHCTLSEIYISTYLPLVFRCLEILQLSIISCWKSGSPVRTEPPSGNAKLQSCVLKAQQLYSVHVEPCLAQVQLCSVPVRVRPPLTDRQTITMAKSRLLPPTPLPCPE